MVALVKASLDTVRQNPVMYNLIILNKHTIPIHSHSLFAKGQAFNCTRASFTNLWPCEIRSPLKLHSANTISIKDRWFRKLGFVCIQNADHQCTHCVSTLFGSANISWPQIVHWQDMDCLFVLCLLFLLFLTGLLSLFLLRSLHFGFGSFALCIFPLGTEAEAESFRVITVLRTPGHGWVHSPSLDIFHICQRSGRLGTQGHNHLVIPFLWKAAWKQHASQFKVLYNLQNSPAIFLSYKSHVWSFNGSVNWSNGWPLHSQLPVDNEIKDDLWKWKNSSQAEEHMLPKHTPRNQRCKPIPRCAPPKHLRQMSMSMLYSPPETGFGKALGLCILVQINAWF